MSENEIMLVTQASQVNRTTIIRLLSKFGPVSCSDLAKRLKVPPATVARHAIDLSKKGVLVNLGKPAGHKLVGKPPILFDVNADYAGLIGVELGASFLRLVYSDFKGRVKARHAMPFAGLKPGISGKLAEVIREFRNRCSEKWEGGFSGGVAMGVCGIVNNSDGVVFSGKFRKGFKLGPMLEDALQMPVIIGNDANFAAFGELNFGSADEQKDVFCFLDRGLLGAAILLNGQIYKGHTGMAGELLLGAGYPNSSAEKNFLKMFPFIEHFGLERRMKKKTGRFRALRSGIYRCEMIAELAEKAEKGNRDAQAVIRNEASVFARAFAAFGSLLDPCRMLLCGDFTATGKTGEKILKTEFRNIFGKKIYFYKGLKAPDVGFGALGQDSTAMGGIAVLIERLVREAVLSEKKKKR